MRRNYATSSALVIQPRSPQPNWACSCCSREDKTMTSYFAGVVDFIGEHPHYALAAILLLALSEAIPVIGTVVPGSTLIIGICALATSAHVNPWPLVGAAIVGAIFGDGLSFWLGRRYHREILLRWPLNRYPQFIDRSEAFIKTYGGASVFLARFIAVVRAFVPLVAGILGKSSRQFSACDPPNRAISPTVSAAVRALRSYLNRHPFPPSLPDIAA